MYDRIRTVLRNTMDTPKRVSTAYQEYVRPEREYNKAGRFVNRLFERLLRDEITYPDLQRAIRQEAEHPSILALKKEMLWSSFSYRRIAYELFRE